MKHDQYVGETQVFLFASKCNCRPESEQYTLQPLWNTLFLFMHFPRDIYIHTNGMAWNNLFEG